MAAAGGAIGAAAAVLLSAVWGRSNQEMAELRSAIASLSLAQERVDTAVRNELSRNREETSQQSRQLRAEVTEGIAQSNQAMLASLEQISRMQAAQLETFSARLTQLASATETRFDALRNSVDSHLSRMRDETAGKLDEIRTTVDDKLHVTLEKRLGESFRLVSDRLEQVHKGLGEMHNLASGVGDLKRVLTNVKTRGTLGEVQLGSLLEQILTPEQYESNVAIHRSGGERVDFALKLPGRDEAGTPVWLPIDAKFPLEDYQRLADAQANADSDAAQQAALALEQRLKTCARDIRNKYLNPPATTDFAIMFLPTEGLYAEAIRKPGFIETLQRDCRVIPAGPTTLAALLNSLQMGFRTLAIQKRSSEIWKLLGAVKTEFGRFGGLLDGVHRRLEQATRTIEDAARKSRTIERKLQGVEELPVPEATLMLVGTEEDDAVNS